jgi:hypothetical protein
MVLPLFCKFQIFLPWPVLTVKRLSIRTNVTRPLTDVANHIIGYYTQKELHILTD